LTIDLEDNEAGNDYAGEGQQQFNRPTDQASKGEKKPVPSRKISTLIVALLVYHLLHTV
jgi:hypothetical protein